MTILAILAAAAVAAADPPAAQAARATAPPDRPPSTIAPVVVAPRRPLDDPLIARGQALVRARCVGCHSVRPTGVSLNPRAPPFRLLGGLGPEVLRRVAVEIEAGDHAAMPPMVLTPGEAEAISAFVRAYAKADPKTQAQMSVAPCFLRAC